MTKSKTTVAIMATALLIGATSAATAESHRARPGMGPGMMGQGCGLASGMMGQMPGQQPGMMGQGCGMAPGMMGPGMRVTPTMHLTTDDVRAFFERHLQALGNDRLKVGKVEAVDDDTIAADVVTVDDSLVESFEVDRRTGLVTPQG